MSIHFGVLRSLVALTLSAVTLTGCIVETGDSEEDSVADLDNENTDEAASAASLCTAAATFTYSTSGDTTTALLNGTAVAWFTKGAYTVRMTGPSRTFAAGNVAGVPAVTTTNWVRTMATPFDPATVTTTTRSAWLNAARAVNCATGTSDVLAIAYEYVEGTTKDAAYLNGSDFHDYLGISWTPIDGSTVSPDPAQLGGIDCSGYMRLVWGYRSNFTYNSVAAKIPLSLYSSAGIPRASRDIYQSAPGKILVPFRTQPAGATSMNGAPTATELALMQSGDLVFFDSSCDYTAATPVCGADWNAIGHVGMYIGRDSNGDYRFLSSRSQANGPTVANTGGWSVFNAAVGVSGTYPKRFRASRRL